MFADGVQLFFQSPKADTGGMRVGGSIPLSISGGCDTSKAGHWAEFRSLTEQSVIFIFVDRFKKYELYYLFILKYIYIIHYNICDNRTSLGENLLTHGKNH